MNKPREFWLCGDHDDEYDTGYSVFTDGDEAKGTTYDVKIHVIEKSYYDELLAKYNFMVSSAQQNAKDRDYYENKVKEVEAKLSRILQRFENGCGSDYCQSPNCHCFD